MATVGKVNDISTEHDIEWKISNFSLLSGERGAFYTSPTFVFANETWCLMIYPNGHCANDSIGYVSLYLRKNSGKSSIKIEFTLGLKTLTGKKDQENHLNRKFKKEENGVGFYKFILRSQLFERKPDLLPSDVLTVFCNLKTPKSAAISCKNETAKCCHCKETCDVDVLPSHEKKCMDKPVKCPHCSDIVTLQNWYDHDCETGRAEETESLCENFKNMLLDGYNHDLILKVGDKEFRAHRDVLMARSKVFKSMFSHNMKEKNSGVINIPDCDPQAMEQFLFYVYSGKVESIDQNNMSGLYYIADKYEMNDLKKKCLTFIKESLSLTNFSEIIQLAVNHSDSSLIDFATEYFIANMLDILCTVEWQSFMKDNSTVANELFIQSCKRKKINP